MRLHVSRQDPFAPRELPRFFATMSPADSLRRPTPLMDSRPRLAYPRRRVSQVPRPVSRRALPPITPEGPSGCACWLLRQWVSGRPFSGRKTAFNLCFEAESGLLALRPAPSLSRASDRGLPHRPPALLRDEPAIVTVNTSHFTRLARLGLAHRRHGGPTRTEVGAGRRYAPRLGLLGKRGTLVSPGCTMPIPHPSAAVRPLGAATSDRAGSPCLCVSVVDSAFVLPIFPFDATGMSARRVPSSWLNAK